MTKSTSGMKSIYLFYAICFGCVLVYLFSGSSSRASSLLSRSPTAKKEQSLRNSDGNILQLAFKDCSKLPHNYPGQSLSPPQEIWLPEGQREPSNKFISPQRIFEEINKCSHCDASRYAINIGAAGSKCDQDVTYCVLDEWNQNFQFGALLFEGRHSAAETLRQQMHLKYGDRNNKIDVVEKFAQPSELPDILEQHNVPKNPAWLKVDIDSYDWPMVESILTRVTPRVIWMEVNGEVPPPIQFAARPLEYTVGVHNDEDEGAMLNTLTGFYGASFAYVTAMLKSAGYRPLQIVLYNAVWIHESVADPFKSVTKDVDELFCMGKKGFADHYYELGLAGSIEEIKADINAAKQKKESFPWLAELHIGV